MDWKSQKLNCRCNFYKKDDREFQLEKKMSLSNMKYWEIKKYICMYMREINIVIKC